MCLHLRGYHNEATLVDMGPRVFYANWRPLALTPNGRDPGRECRFPETEI